MRTRRIRGFAKKHPRASRLLFKGGALLQSTYGHQIWITPPTSMRWNVYHHFACACHHQNRDGISFARGSHHRVSCVFARQLFATWQLLLRRFERTARKRRWFQVTGFLSNVIAILLELEWKPVTATHWINDLEDTWTFDLSKTLILSPSSMTLSEHPCDICGEQLLYIDMEKVLQLQHQISRCCADIFTVSEREVCLREPLWRPVACAETP